jgi:hypothetical protein
VIVFDYTQFGGKHGETGALKNVLAHLDVKAPHTGQSYNESLLFGIGGGIGFAYFLFEKSGSHPIHLGTRLHTKETERPEFYQNIARRLSVPLRVQNSSSATAASANLKRFLERGQAPIVSVDPERLPYLGLNAPLYSYHTVVAYGMDDDQKRVSLADGCPQPVSLTEEEFRTARETSWSPKYRAVVIERPAAEPDLKEAVIQGIHDCCRQMNEGLGITNFGLRGLEKWATVLTSAREKKSWPKIFSPGATLYKALYSIFAQISGRGSTGHANRTFYADFLDEASGILSNPGLRDAAQGYRKAAEVWGEVADAHLPSSEPLFAEAKELTTRRVDLFESKGTEAAGEIQQIKQRLNEIASEASGNFPLSFQDSRALLNGLRQRVLQLRDVEADATGALQAAIGYRANSDHGSKVGDFVPTEEFGEVEHAGHERGSG